MPYKDRDKQREFQKKWVSQRRSEFFSGKCCSKCGSYGDLELDHVNMEDKVSHRIWSWTESKRLEELKKCQVLCHDCHNEKSLEDKKLYCNRGHFYSVFGKTEDGKCAECRRLKEYEIF